MEAKTYKIVNGPNDFDLSISLFRRKDGDRVYFSLEGVIDPAICFINGVKAIDESSTSNWHIQGFLTQGLLTQYFVARYSTNTRKGTFTVLRKKKR